MHGHTNGHRTSANDWLDQTRSNHMESRPKILGKVCARQNARRRQFWSSVRAYRSANWARICVCRKSDETNIAEHISGRLSERTAVFERRSLHVAGGTRRHGQMRVGSRLLRRTRHCSLGRQYDATRDRYELFAWNKYAINDQCEKASRSATVAQDADIGTDGACGASFARHCASRHQAGQLAGF